MTLIANIWCQYKTFLANKITLQLLKLLYIMKRMRNTLRFPAHKPLKPLHSHTQSSDWFQFNGVCFRGCVMLTDILSHSKTKTHGSLLPPPSTSCPDASASTVPPTRDTQGRAAQTDMLLMYVQFTDVQWVQLVFTIADQILLPFRFVFSLHICIITPQIQHTHQRWWICFGEDWQTRAW